MMAIKVSGTEVVSSSRELINITGIDATTQATFENTLDLNNRSVGTVTGNATLDLSTGTIFEHTPTDNTTFVFSNPPASGTGYSFDLKVTGAEVGGPYDIANASYDGVYFSHGSQINTFTSALKFNPTGTKAYIMGNGSIYQYTLTTGFDVTTASYDSVSFHATSQDTTPLSLAFNTDGTKMFISGGGSGAVYQYTISTGFDLSTASYDSVSFSVASQAGNPTDITFNVDGTSMLILDDVTDAIYQYTLSTGFDLSTASYASVSFSFTPQTSSTKQFTLSGDGTKLVVFSTTNDLYLYTLSSAFNISSASYDNISLDTFTPVTFPTSVTFKPDGSKMYITGYNWNQVFQYTSGSTPSPIPLTYPASVEWLDASAPSDPADGEVLSLQFFTTDGGTTYYGSRNGSVAELSTQTATTTSTTQTAIASYPTATYDAVKVVITADDGTDRTTTEMVVTWKSTTAYSTEYATVNTGAAALATFDADVSGSNFRILATPAASTSTAFTVKAITL
jgi:hypothetical protein